MQAHTFAGALSKKSLSSPSIDSDDDSLPIVKAAYAGLPTPLEMSQLVADGQAAEDRGYFNPNEDERLRDAYARYLAIRVSLWGLIQKSRPAAHRVQADPLTANAKDMSDFAIAFSAAEIIVRTGEYLIDLARNRDIIWRKLDEAESRYGIRRKSFTRLYRQLTSAYHMYGFYRARDVFDANKSRIMAAAPDDIAKILTTLNLPSASRGDHLRRYRRFVRHSLKRRQLSAWKKILFSLFEMTGSDIADLTIPFVKPPQSKKRVSPEVIEKIRAKLQPGDVFVTRHDDALSNLFLPGSWPHSALWLGAADADILEAKKDGVLLRQIEETLQVDAFVVIRPKLSANDLAEALTRARTHTGKLYDFVFDFSTSDRLVCTEVIYRTYHGQGEIDFQLGLKAGRHCLSAEDLLNQAIGKGWFDVVAIYGVGGNEMLEGGAAREKLRDSFASRF